MRNPWAEYAKGIGIALVVYGHVARGLYAAKLWPDAAVFTLLDSVVYSFHMPLFFFLSGLFFHRSLQKRGPAGLIANKVDTLIYPYVLWSILQGTIEVSLNRWTNTPTTLHDVFSLLWAPRAQFWFLYALFLICVVGAGVYRFLDEKYFPAVAAAAALLFLLQGIVAAVPPVRYVFTYFVFFATGLCFVQIQQTIFQYRRWLVLPMLLGFVAAQYSFHIASGLTYTHVGLSTVGVALESIGFVVILCMCLSGPACAVLALLGTLSMAIYLLHILIAAGIRIIATRYLHWHDLPALLALGCLGGIFLSVAAYQLATRAGFGWLFFPPRVLSLERKRSRD